MRISETERALKEELYEKFAVNVEVTFLWEYQTEEVIHNEVNLVKITQIRVKIIEHQEEEVVKKMWEYLTKNYCSEVLIE